MIPRLAGLQIFESEFQGRDQLAVTALSQSFDGSQSQKVTYSSSHHREGFGLWVFSGISIVLGSACLRYHITCHSTLR